MKIWIWESSEYWDGAWNQWGLYIQINAKTYSRKRDYHYKYCKKIKDKKERKNRIDKNKWYKRMG